MFKIKAHVPVITTVDVPDTRVKDYLSSQNPPVTGSKEVSDPHREEELLPLYQVRPQPLTSKVIQQPPLHLPDSQ